MVLLVPYPFSGKWVVFAQKKKKGKKKALTNPIIFKNCDKPYKKCDITYTM